MFDLLLLHICFPLDVGGSGRLHTNLNKKKNNKYFMCVTINNMTIKGKHCICHTCKDKLLQNQGICLKQMLNYQLVL